MESISRLPRTSFGRSELLLMGGLLLVGEVLGIGISFATRSSNPDLSKAFAAGASGLLFGAMLGGIVSLLLAELDRRRVRRAAQIEYITNVLADLKSVHDQVDRGRTLITAHQSAATYGEELRNFIAARIKLQQVIRALNFDERRAAIVGVLPFVVSMDAYLRALVEEFETSYKAISRAQSVYEGRMKKAIESAVASGGETIPLPMNEPWERILALSRVSRFIAAREDLPSSPSSEYATRFLGPLDAASSGLRTALDEQLTGRIRSRPGLGSPHSRSERAAPEGLPPTAVTRIVDNPPTDRSTQRPDPVTQT